MQLNEEALLQILHQQAQTMAALLDSHITLLQAETGKLDEQLPKMLTATHVTILRLERLLFQEKRES